MFAFYTLLNLYQQGRVFKYQQQTTGIINFKLDLYKSEPIQIPDDHRVQSSIAAAIDQIREHIRLLEKVIAKQERVRKGLLQALLTRGIDENGEIRELSGQNQQIHRLGVFPVNWRILPLSKAAECLDSRRVPVNSVERSKRSGSVPYYGANGLQGYIDKPIFDERLILLAEDGGNFDQFATRPIAYQIDGPSWVNNHAHVLRHSVETDFDFLFYALVHKDIRFYISGGTRAKLTRSELDQIEIPVPDIEEQVRVVSCIKMSEDVLARMRNKLQKVKRLKTGLMRDLLSGRVSVEPLLDLPSFSSENIEKP